MADDLEHRIRDTAYRLWENAGRPESRSEEFWDLARELEHGPKTTNIPGLEPTAVEPSADPDKTAEP